MEQRFEGRLEQRQTVLPQLIEANNLLQMSALLLNAEIAQHISSNPALELDETPTCPRCGAAIEWKRCPVCEIDPFDVPSPEKPPDYEFSPPATSLIDTEERVDQFSYIAGEGNPLEEIRIDALASTATSDHQIVETIIGSLNERGWLSTSVDAIADACATTPDHVATVLDTFQRIAPAGVGAIDLNECLALQLRELRNADIEFPRCAEPLVIDHLEDLAAHRYHQLAKTLGVAADQIGEAHEFIRDHLSPNPLQDSVAITWRHAASIQTAVPDVVYRIVEGELRVEIATHDDGRLVINDEYVNLSRRRNKANGSSDGDTGWDGIDLDEEALEHVRSSVRSARDFLSKLAQRRKTLLWIATLIGERQERYIRSGSVREIVPLTRSEIAAELGVNESTVSRAVADKHVMLPNRQIVSFATFFAASLHVKDVIREIIANESANGSSLSDQQICDRLNDAGFRIARRTVTKYRLQLVIPSSNQRLVTSA